MSRFRSNYNLGDVLPETMFTEPSQTVAEFYEPLQALLERMTRQGSRFRDVHYEEESGDFDDIEPHREDGFDIADAPAIVERAMEGERRLRASAPEREEDGIPTDDPEQGRARPRSDPPLPAEGDEGRVNAKSRPIRKRGEDGRYTPSGPPSSDSEEG